MRAPIRVLPLLAILVPQLSASQDPAFVWHTPRSSYLFREEAPPAYVLGTDVALRSAPSTMARLVSELALGTRLFLEEWGTDTLADRGIRSLWYRVTVGEQSGWVWGGNIAQRVFGSTADPTVKFVAGIDHITPSDTGAMDFSYRIVAIRDGRELDRVVARSFAWGFEGVTNVGNLGLKNVDDVFLLNVPCVGGCGCTTGDVVVFWSGGKFHRVAALMGSPDGEFSTNVSLVYPSDMEGLPGTIIRVTGSYDDTEPPPREDGEEEERSLTRFVLKEYLKWDGKALVPSGKPSEEMEYKMPID